MLKPDSYLSVPCSALENNFDEAINKAKDFHLKKLYLFLRISQFKKQIKKINENVELNTNNIMNNFLKSLFSVLIYLITRIFQYFFIIDLINKLCK
ncbi:hypothetical protein BpHYR1_002864 [Brachionus plicatilis]|uniref:Uncharacterized protein n=1 Tax=Brachionus plicatilis TaxID=10195 RepID=A0A3M7QRU2_BRAPC|nr:hypothetical protein BpHYR1_002864 [Brachionus plicatilis]